MSFLSGIGGWLRKELDDAGSFVTGQPVHAPTPPPSPITINRTSPPNISVNNAPNPQQISLNSSRPPQISLPSPGNPNHPNTWGTTPPHPNLFHQAINMGNRDIVRPLLSADRYIANNMGLTDAAKASGLLPATSAQRFQSAKNLVEGAIKFPVQAGQQLSNTGLQMFHVIPHDVPGSAPSLQHQYQAIKKTNGRIPATLETGLSAVMDVAPLAGGIKGGAPKVAEKKAAIDENLNQAAMNHPAIQARIQHINQQKQMYDSAKSAQTKSAISKSIAQNNAALANEFNLVRNQLRQTGAVGKNVLEPNVPEVPKTQLEHAKLLDNLEATTGTNTPQYHALMNDYITKYGDKPVTQPTQGAMPSEPPDFLKVSPKYAAKQAKQEGIALRKGQSPEGQLSPTTTKKLERYGQDGRQSRGKVNTASDVSSGQIPRNHIGLSDRTSQPSSKSNYTTNPTKVEIPEVKVGDYEKARSNAQLASQPIEYASGQVARIARSEKMSTSRLGRLVEGTDSPKNAAEREAIKRYRQFADRVHATSQSLGGNTPYRPNYYHHEWDLSNPEQAARFEQFRQRKFGSELDPTQFQGLDTQPRVFDTVAQGEAARFKLKNPNAAEDILDYAKKSASALKRQALAKGFMEADAAELNKPNSFDMGMGKTLALSNKGLREIRAFEKSKQAGTPLKIYRGGNRKLKQTLLSASEFHPINITKKVAPGIALEGHPVLATKGAYGAFRAQVGRKYSDTLQQKFQEDGLVDFGARVGSPIKFGSDYASEGKLDLGKAGFGEKTIFEKSMPALHGRALQALKADLDKKGISYDSPEARRAGTRINEMMGFINTEVRNLDKGHQKFLGDVALAPQFTRAKWATIKSALHEGGVAGSYARRAVIGDVLATATVMLGLGYIAKQKSDDIKDLLIRALVHPSVPTPMKDSKGNNIELGMPSTYTSEALGLVANIKRNQDGHLGITFKPGNFVGNLEDYGRARLAIIPGSGLKVATNTNFANKPLYDPNAPAGTKVQQAATTLFTGALPIGLQGAAQTNAVKQHLPQGMQDVLTVNTPGSNPVLKSVGASFGLTPRTDKTVGKGLQTTQYFDALDIAKQGLNSREQATLEAYAGSKKNPVTGKYDIQPNVNDQRRKASDLLDDPTVIGHLITMNQKLASEGQSVDPLWQQPRENIVKYLQYQSMPPAGPDQIDWRNKNPWYQQLAVDRSNFFDSLPPGDPNKPKAPIEFPTPDSQTSSDMNTYFKMSDPSQRAQFLQTHPNVADQFDKQANYNNQLRVAQGYGALRTYPKPNAHVQAILDSMPRGNDRASKKARALAYQDPQVAQWAQEDAIYNLTKGAAVAQIQGNSLTSKDLKATQSLQYDIMKNPDGSLSLMYGDPQGGYGAAPIQPGAISQSPSSIGLSHSKRKPMFYRRNPKKIYIKKPHKARKVHLQKPPNPVKIKNKAPKHTGIKSKSYL